jgi:hypothetical protein
MISFLNFLKFEFLNFYRSLSFKGFIILIKIDIKKNLFQFISRSFYLCFFFFIKDHQYHNG